MTPQEIFDTGFKAIVAQGGPGRTRSGICSYYDERTQRRCVAGMLMPPEVAKHVQDCNFGSVFDFAREDRTLPEGVPDWFKPNATLIRQMQIAHDASIYDGETRCELNDEQFLEKFAQAMSDLAAVKHLDPAVTELVAA
jgi:hypothetical protein